MIDLMLDDLGGKAVIGSGVASEFLKETDPRRGTIEYNAKRKGIDKFEIIWYSVDPALKDKTFKITVEVTQ